jgi:hypothetical protein
MVASVAHDNKRFRGLAGRAGLAQDGRLSRRTVMRCTEAVKSDWLSWPDSSAPAGPVTASEFCAGSPADG